MTIDRDPDGFAELRKLGSDIPETDDAAKARALARLESAIQRERATSRGRTLKRWVALTAAIVAVSITAALVLREGAELSGPHPAILQLAAVASTQPPPMVPAGSFAYTKAKVRATVESTNISTGATETEVVASLRETWISADGSGLILDRLLPLGSGKPRSFRGGPGELRFPSLNQLPTEPGAFLDAIRGPGFLDEPDNDFEILSGIGALLRDPYVDPSHRRALFLIVQGIEGVDVIERYRDPLGRLGTALSLREGARSVTLVFEPRTSRLLEEGETNIGNTFYEATYVQTGVVRAIGERPGEPGV